MKRILLLFGLLFLANILIGQTTQKDTVNVKPFEDLTLVTDGTVDTSDQLLIYDISSGTFAFRGSLGELLKKIADVQNIISTSNIVNATIEDEDISGSAGIGLNKLATSGTGKILLTDSGGAGTWVSGTPGYGLSVSGTTMIVDTSDAAGLVSKSRLTNALDDVSGGGGLTSIDTAQAYTAEVSFTENRQITHTASSNITFTANTTGAVPGAFSTYRIDFGGSGYTVDFSGSEFDTVQMYNISSGDTLRGIHIIEFWYTQGSWDGGVAVAVPTNFSATSEPDTVGTPSGNPITEKAGLQLNLDGESGITTDGDTIEWASTGVTNTAKSTNISKKPAIAAVGIDFAGTGDFLELDNTVALNVSNFSLTLAYNNQDPTDNFQYILGRDDLGYLALQRDRPADDRIYFADQSLIGLTDQPTSGPEIIQASCSGGTCEIWIDGVSQGTVSGSGGTITMIGTLAKSSTNGLNGIIYHLAIHNSAYTGTERSDIFDYLNTKYSLGL